VVESSLVEILKRCKYVALRHMV